MTTISATTVLRSRNAAAPDKILSTLLLRYPRFIHAELMTHRALSRNAASSRAIPVKKIIDDILADTAMPIHWGKNQPGMQAHEHCDAKVNILTGLGIETLYREDAWLLARDNAIQVARAFNKAGYHKQVINRLLEPFMHITVLVSATEWDNFLELRDHEDAEPHIQMLAREIKRRLDDHSTVRTLKPGQWHMPFVTGYEPDVFKNSFIDHRNKGYDDAGAYTCAQQDMISVSVARCASTSYKTVDGFDMTLEKAQQVFDKLVNSKPIHASPLEHVAQADELTDIGETGPHMVWQNRKQHGNFVGFKQYRHMLN